MSSTAAGNAVAAPSSSNATALMMRHTPIVRRPRPAPNNDAELVAVVAVALVAVISVHSRSGSVPTQDTGPAGRVGFRAWLLDLLSATHRIVVRVPASSRWCCSSH